MSLAALRVNITRIKKELVSAMRNTQRKINTEMGKNKRQANKNELCTFQDRHLARKQGRYHQSYSEGSRAVPDATICGNTSSCDIPSATLACSDS